MVYFQTANLKLLFELKKEFKIFLLKVFLLVLFIIKWMLQNNYINFYLSEFLNIFTGNLLFLGSE